MSLTVPAQFHRMLRSQAAVLALRYPVEGGWLSLTWGEVLQRVEGVAFALRNLPRTPWRWRAGDPGQRLVVSLALLHLGVPGEEGEEEGNPNVPAGQQARKGWAGGGVTGDPFGASSVSREAAFWGERGGAGGLPDRARPPAKSIRAGGQSSPLRTLRPPWGEEGEPPELAAPRGFLQQRLQELRPRDPGWGGKDQGTLAAEAERRAPIFAGREVLVSAAEVEAGFAAAWAGGTLVVGGPECLPVVAPEAWITDAGGIDRLGLPPSRLGGLGRFVRSVGRAEGSLGPRLREVWVVGRMPGNSRPLTDRGVQLRDWGI